MELKARRFSDTSSIEIVDGNGKPVAQSRNAYLFIFNDTPLETAIEVAERFGRRFDTVLYKGYDAWFPSVEVAADWAC